jgi:hypothetical protein
MRRFLPALICLILATTGCALTHPLGEGYESLDSEEKNVRALDALRDLFANGVNGAGGPAPDRDVASCTSQSIVYTVDDVTSTLRWRDVESVETRSHEDVPARPETLQLFLARESPSTISVADCVKPSLMSTGLVRSYVELRSRPRWSANRLRAALKRVDRARAPRAREEHDAAQPPSETEAPRLPSEARSEPDSDLDVVEGKLRRLKQWHDDGLIDDAEYEQKRQELLRGL